MKKITGIAWVSYISIIGITICSIATSSCDHVSALEYTTHYGNSFTLLPSISVSLSSASSTGSNSSNSNNASNSANLIISDLLPNSSQDSNEIIVNVESNNVSGYVLNSSVGSSTITGSNNTSYNNRNLTNTSSNSYIFTSLDYGSSIPDMSSSSVDPNTWGYSYATTSTTNVETGSNEWNWSNYSGLPLYSDTTNIATLKSSNTPSSANGDNISFKIAAKASITQGSGEYTNIINFIAVGNPTPTSFYDAFATAASQPGSTISQLNGYYKMQDMTADICDAVDLYDDNSHIQLIDTRDNEVYWIGKLKDNRCWLLDNLRLGSNDHSIDLTPEDTNIAEDWTLPKGITSNFGSYTTAQINAAYKNDTNVTSHGTASGKVGVYYNYCAASGGTYCYPEEEGIDDDQRDVCPANWRLPTGGAGSEYWASCTIYKGSSCIKWDHSGETFQQELSTLLSGAFSGSSQNSLNSIGRFLSSTYYDPSKMSIFYSGSTVNVFDWGDRKAGLSIRCIANNE